MSAEPYTYILESQIYMLFNLFPKRNAAVLDLQTGTLLIRENRIERLEGLKSAYLFEPEEALKEARELFPKGVIFIIKPNKKDEEGANYLDEELSYREIKAMMAEINFDDVIRFWNEHL